MSQRYRVRALTRMVWGRVGAFHPGGRETLVTWDSLGAGTVNGDPLIANTLAAAIAGQDPDGVFYALTPVDAKGEPLPSVVAEPASQPAGPQASVPEGVSSDAPASVPEGASSDAAPDPAPGSSGEALADTPPPASDGTPENAPAPADGVTDATRPARRGKG